jgi:hypothetical protein
MKLEDAEAEGALVRYPCLDRIGMARLTTMAFGGTDLRPLLEPPTQARCSICR